MPCASLIPISNDSVRDMLSLRETTVLAEISETKVRKDIENGLLTPRRTACKCDNRIWFGWVDVFSLGAVYRNRFLSPSLRDRALKKLDLLTREADFKNLVGSYGLASCVRPLQAVDIDTYVIIDFDRVFGDLTPRVRLYAEGLKRTEELDSVLGGEAVFRGTRLSVRHVGKMLDSGERIGNILDDYPFLEENDVKFAHLYYLAHPIVGRPRSNVGAGDDAEMPS